MVLDSGANLGKKNTHSGQDGPHISFIIIFNSDVGRNLQRAKQQFNKISI